jgi:hypothetical protein
MLSKLLYRKNIAESDYGKEIIDQAREFCEDKATNRNISAERIAGMQELIAFLRKAPDRYEEYSKK